MRLELVIYCFKGGAIRSLWCLKSSKIHTYHTFLHAHTPSRYAWQLLFLGCIQLWRWYRRTLPRSYAVPEFLCAPRSTPQPDCMYVHMCICMCAWYLKQKYVCMYMIPWISKCTRNRKHSPYTSAHQSSPLMFSGISQPLYIHTHIYTVMHTHIQHQPDCTKFKFSSTTP